MINCFRDKWWVRWQANGWRNAKKEPVANVDLWKPLIELVLERSPHFRWVKGHSGDPMNDLVDAMAVAASKGPFTEPRRRAGTARRSRQPRLPLRRLTAPVDLSHPACGVFPGTRVGAKHSTRAVWSVLGHPGERETLHRRVWVG